MAFSEPGVSPTLTQLQGAPRGAQARGEERSPAARPAGSRSPRAHRPRAGARRPPGTATAWHSAIDQASPAGVRFLARLLVCCCTFQDISILTVSKCLSIVVSGLFLFSSCWAPSLLA